MIGWLLCHVGRHRRALRYEREGIYLHYLAVCERCGNAKPTQDRAHPQVLRIPTRQERRANTRRHRREQHEAREQLRRLDEQREKLHRLPQ